MREHRHHRRQRAGLGRRVRGRGRSVGHSLTKNPREKYLLVRRDLSSTPPDQYDIVRGPYTKLWPPVEVVRVVKKGKGKKPRMLIEAQQYGTHYWGWVNHDEIGPMGRLGNPATSPEQYRLAQAVLSGTARETSMPKDVAREIVERTPARLRSEFSRYRNPEEGEDHEEISGHVDPQSTARAFEEHLALVRDPAFKDADEQTQAAILTAKDTEDALRGESITHAHTENPIGTVRFMSLSTEQEAQALAHYIHKKGGFTPNYVKSIRGYDMIVPANKEGFAKALYRDFSKHTKNPAKDAAVGETWEYAVRAKKAGKWKTFHEKSRITKIGEGGLSITFANGRTITNYGTSHHEEGLIRRVSSNPEDRAIDLAESFHGRKSEDYTEFTEPEHYHGHLAGLGQLIELKICTVTKLNVTLSFDYDKKAEQVTLASNEDGTQLYFVGGDQSLPLEKMKLDDKKRDSMRIGECYFISYLTEKDFDAFETIVYEHEFGKDEDTRKKVSRPTLRYDLMNKRLYLDGGEYVIKKPLLETSRGIER